METNSDPQPDSDVVVNLGPLTAACRELTDWYDRLTAGEQPPIGDLDRVVTTLQVLPPVPGRVGRDIQIIIDGGHNATRDQIIGAVERLRSVGGHKSAPRPATPAADHPPRRRPRLRRKRRPTTDTENVNQNHLPGLEPGTDNP